MLSFWCFYFCKMHTSSEIAGSKDICFLLVIGVARLHPSPLKIKKLIAYIFYSQYIHQSLFPSSPMSHFLLYFALSRLVMRLSIFSYVYQSIWICSPTFLFGFDILFFHWDTHLFLKIKLIRIFLSHPWQFCSMDRALACIWKDPGFDSS